MPQTDKAIDPWRDPFSGYARHLASAIMQRYRRLQEEEAGVSEYAEVDAINRIRRRLHDDWYHDLLAICDGTLKHLTDTIDYLQKIEIERINVFPSVPFIATQPRVPCACWWCRAKAWIQYSLGIKE